MEKLSENEIERQFSSALQNFEKQHIIDLFYHVVRTYVVDGTGPLKMDFTVSDFPTIMRDLSFPQVVAQLKKQLRLPELNLFQVINNEVFVTIGDKDISLSAGAERALTASETSGRSPSSPTSDGIGIDIDMREPKPSSPEPSPSSPARPDPAANVMDNSPNNRFSMLDID